MLQKMISVSVSVVVYKPDLVVLQRSLESIKEALDYLLTHVESSVSVVVVDNSMDSRCTSEVRGVVNGVFQNIQVALIESASNGGYGAGNNQAINQVGSDYHLVANPDIFVSEDSIYRAISYLEANPQTVLVTPQVTGEDGALHHLCKLNPTLFVMFLRSFAPSWLRKLFSSYLNKFEMMDHDYAGVIPGVAYPTGCFMFCRTKALQDIGGFDEHYFLHFEDADIGRRIVARGRIDYVPTVKIVHRWARGSHTNWFIRWVTIKSAFIYFSKWGGLYKLTGNNR